jgi:hypothetical protein
VKKPKKPNPVVLLRVEVTPELAAMLKWRYPLTVGTPRVLLNIFVRNEVEYALQRYLDKDDAAGPDTPVDDLELSVRAANLLQHHGVRTAGELARWRGNHWYAAPKVVAEFRAVLAPLGLKLRGDT